MQGPIIRERSTWRILIDAAIQFSHHIGYFFLFSIFPLTLLYFSTPFACLYTGSFAVLILSIPVFIFCYGIALLTSWELMWGGTPDFGRMAGYLLKTLGKFTLTMLLYWIAISILPILMLILVYKIFLFIFGSKRTGVLPGLILFLFLMLLLPILLMCIPGLAGIGVGIFLLVIFFLVFVVSIPFIMLILTPSIILLDRCSTVRSFIRSMKFTWGYWLHAMPFVLLNLISIVLIIIVSIGLAAYLSGMVTWSQGYLTFVIAGILNSISIPFFINLRVFYYQDLILRQEGYDSLLTTRQACQCGKPW